MKKIKITMSSILMIAAILFSSCDKEDRAEREIADKYKDALTALYPEAKQVEWSVNGTYGVADFHYNGSQTKVWFADNASSKWQMIETEITYQSLPKAVQDAFMASEYKSFRIEEVEKLVRYGVQPIYTLEVENNTQEVDLYYSETGVLVKSIIDTDDDENHQSMLPTGQAPAEVMQIINQKYPDSRVLEYEQERGFWVVEILHDAREKDVSFDSDNKWSHTKWDIRRNELPQAITTTIESQYSGYTIDDVEYVESIDSTWYNVDLEKNDRELTIRITAEGSILK